MQVMILSSSAPRDPKLPHGPVAAVAGCAVALHPNAKSGAVCDRPEAEDAWPDAHDEELAVLAATTHFWEEIVQ